MAMTRFIALLVQLAVVRAQPQCIAAQGSCDPVTDRCCQGPGLMTCRLRPSTRALEGDTGMAYVCGEEFPYEKTAQCVAEGQDCNLSGHCCDVGTMKMTCQIAGLKRRMCKPEFKEQLASCVAEGDSCDPVRNSCCQGANGASADM